VVLTAIEAVDLDLRRVDLRQFGLLPACGVVGDLVLSNWCCPRLGLTDWCG
jgi:hypothetical protein